MPFLLFGAQVEAALEAWRASPPPPLTVAAAVIALLSTDILLPIPSSLACTLAGWQFGVPLGFFLTKRCGPRLVAWLVHPGDLARTSELSERFGPTLLILSRGVPVLAKASVLILGLHSLTWR